MIDEMKSKVIMLQNKNIFIHVKNYTIKTELNEAETRNLSLTWDINVINKAIDVEPTEKCADKLNIKPIVKLSNL